MDHRYGQRIFPRPDQRPSAGRGDGEVARVISRTYGAQRAKPGDSLDLADELADLLWVLTAVANQTGVDLTEALERNLRKKNSRDAHRFE